MRGTPRVRSWATTDEKGCYRIDGLPPGNLDLEASAPSLPRIRPWPDVSLAPAEVRQVDFALPPARPRFVTVVDEGTGTPVPEAEVLVSHRSTKGPGERLETPPLARESGVAFRVRAPGYFEAICRWPFHDGDPSIFRVALPRAIPVSGTVVGVDGRPAAGVRIILEAVALRRPFGSPSLAEATSGPDGTFAVAAAAADSTLVWSLPLEAGGWRRGPTVSVPADATTVALPPISLGGTVSLRGRILDDGGRPVKRGVLTASPLPTPDGAFAFPFSAVVSDPRGRFLLPGIPAGKVRLTLDMVDGFATCRRDFDLAKDETVEWKLAPGKEVAGLVVREDGTPAAGVKVSVGEDDVTADAEGRFRLRGLPDGDVDISVRLDSTWADATVPAGTTDVRLTLTHPGR